MNRLFTVLFPAICLFLFSPGLSAQDTLAFQGFESAASDTWTFTPNPVAFTPNSASDYWGVVSSLGPGGTITPATNGGSQFWGVLDLANNVGGTATNSFGTLTFPAVSTSGYAGFQVSFDYQVSGFDAGDDITAQVIVDGTAQPVVLVVDGINNFTTGNWVTYTFNWAPAASSIGFVIGVSQNGDDYGGIDNVRITGTATAGCIISGISLENESACQNNGTSGDASDDFFTADVVVNFTGKPSSGTLNLTGDLPSPMSVAVASTSTATTHTFAGVQFPANGTTGDLTATFSAEPTCTYFANNILPLISACPSSSGFLILSEYIESTNQKFVEIHNPTGAPIDLGNYQLLIYANGSSSSNPPVNMTGTLAPGGFFVLQHNQAATPPGLVADQIAFLGYNGNDAVALVESGIVRDVMGQIGFNPGSSWSGGSCQTEDVNLRKDVSLGQSTADSNPNDAYDPSAHWQYCSASIDYSNLGVGFAFPVELVYFEAEALPGGVKLSWATGSEVANERFEVVRRQQGIETFVLSLPGAGFSNKLEAYEAWDVARLSGRVLYELTQVDIDGSRRLIGRYEVELGSGLRNLAVWPNPSTGSSTLRWETDQQGTGTIAVFGLAGNLLQAHQIEVKPGAQEHPLDLSGLPEGVFYVKFSVNGTNQLVPVVRQ